MNIFRAEYQVVVVRTAPGPGPVCANRKPALVAFVVAAAHYEIADSLGDRVIGIGDLHLEGADGRMPRVGRTQNMPKVRVGQADVSSIVQEQRSAARLHKLTYGLALLGLHPELRLGSRLRQGRIRYHFRPSAARPGGVGAFVAAITIRPDHPVPQNDEDLVTIQRFGIQQGSLIGEIDADSRLAGRWSASGRSVCSRSYGSDRRSGRRR